MGLSKVFRSAPPAVGLHRWVHSAGSLFLRTRRPTIPVLENVNLDVQQGEIFGVVGPNASGKTTLVKILATLLLPTSGTATVGGYDVVRECAEARKLVNYVGSSQWSGFDIALSVQENLCYWASLYGYWGDHKQQRVEEVSQLMELKEVRGKHPMSLSSGMRQRLLLAKGLLADTPLFLLDEPTTGLDPKSARKFRGFLKDNLSRVQRKTIVLTTHYMREAEQLCDRVAILDKGKVIACDTPRSLVRKLGREEVFLVSVEMHPRELQGELERIPEIERFRISPIDDQGILVSSARIHTRRRSAVVSHILDDLGKKTTVRSANVVKPTLEDVFIRLTSQHTR